MYYSLSARQPKELLAQADEIYLEYRDKGILFDYVDDYPDKIICMLIPKDTEVDWTYLEGFQDKLHLTLMFESIKDTYNNKNFPWFWAYPITTYFELDSILKFNNFAEVIIGGPLFFDLENVYNLCQEHGVTIRIAPNLAYDAYIPRRDGIVGTYVRPEDVSYYEPYVRMFFFRFDTLAEERRLFSIYHDDKSWPGNLNLLIKNLNYNVDNRGIDEEFVTRRLSCRQNCCRTGLCHFCESYLNFINTVDKNKKEL